MNFSKLVKPKMVFNNDGELVDLETIDDCSINNIFLGRKILAHEIYTRGSKQMSVLSDELFLRLMMRCFVKGVEEFKNRDKDRLWGITYNQMQFSYVDEIIDRYPKLFTNVGISIQYAGKNKFKEFRMLSQCTNPSVTFKGVEYTSLAEIRKLGAHLTEDSDYRANSAGFSALVSAYPESKFISNAERIAEESSAGDRLSVIMHWFILEFIDRFIEKEDKKETGKEYANF